MSKGFLYCVALIATMVFGVQALSAATSIDPNAGKTADVTKEQVMKGSKDKKKVKEVKKGETASTGEEKTTEGETSK